MKKFNKIIIIVILVTAIIPNLKACNIFSRCRKKPQQEEGKKITAIKKMDIAIRNGNIDLVKEAIANGLNLNIANHNGYPALTSAAYYNQMAIMELLVDKYNVNLNQVNDSDNNSLMIAVALGHKQIVKFLINKYKINVNWKSSKGYTAILWAARYFYTSKSNNYKKIISILALAGANIMSLRDIKLFNLDNQLFDIARDFQELNENLSNLFFAEYLAGNNKEIFLNKILSRIKQLTKQGGSLTYFEDLNGNNALHLAIFNNNIRLAEFILSISPSLIAQKNNKNQTPVELAVGQGHHDFVQKLIKLGDLN